MNERDFGFMTPRSFFNKLKGVVKLREQNFKDEWERTRWLACQLVNVSGKVVKGKLKLTDIIKFNWEKVERTDKDVEKDKEGFERLVKKFGKQWHLN